MIVKLVKFNKCVCNTNINNCKTPAVYEVHTFLLSAYKCQWFNYEHVYMLSLTLLIHSPITVSKHHIRIYNYPINIIRFSTRTVI